MLPCEKDDSTWYGFGGKTEKKVTPRFFSLNFQYYVGTFTELLDVF